MVTAQLTNMWQVSAQEGRGIADYLGPDGEPYLTHGPEADYPRNQFRNTNEIRATQFNATELGKVWK